MDFKHVPKEYRPIPFWSWNEKLEPEETKNQIRQMDEAGIGGFFMHARGGLQTEYMGEEWFENVTASVEEGHVRGMRPWAYDENGWPSGFGNGLVNGMGVEYQQKYLRMEEEKDHEDTAICKSGDHYFYYDVNPFYVDTLDAKVIKKFIEVAYKPYYEKYGNKVEGFFTDEPQISRNGIPWSFVFEEEYRNRYGEELYEHLEELFLEVSDYKQTRIKFWKMVTDLFSQNFMKQIYDQCQEWGMRLTGHLVLEENFWVQLVSNGACMPHYEYMDIPGMDWLGRNIFECLTPLQVSSVAEQLGKDSVLSETFALCGHNVSFAELKGIFEWQMVHGITLLCPHLEGYSIRGIRKRDYPPAMYIQQPWWDAYGKLVDAVSREGMILSKGKKKVDILLLHPQTTAWSLFNNQDTKEIARLNERFLKLIKELEQKHVVFHLGDETILERHGKVENGKLIVGKQSYTYVIEEGCEVLLPHTKQLLKEFKENGGTITTVAEIPENTVIDHKEITYTKRFYDDFTIHYFVNTSPDEKTASFNLTGKRIDLYSGELMEFNEKHTFEPWGSLMVMEMTTKKEETPDMEQTLIRPDGMFKQVDKVWNCLTLDYCDYYFDGTLQEKNGYVLNICERANQLERKVQLHQDYHVMIHDVPKELYLVCEKPENFVISINGQEIVQKIDGYFRDKSFQKVDIAEYVRSGENTISFDCDFEQSEQFYQNLKRSYIFESEKNKLAYDMEIEAVYLLGTFGVKTAGEWQQLEKNAYRYTGSFEIEEQKEELSLQNIEQQGYPFWCGSMTVEGELEILGENPVLKVEMKGINAIKVEIADKEKWILTDTKLPLKEFGVQGKTKVRMTLVNNLRNLLGPHHMEIGECFTVGPHTFFKEPCVWNNGTPVQWNDGYCFVETGI